MTRVGGQVDGGTEVCSVVGHPARALILLSPVWVDE